MKITFSQIIKRLDKFASEFPGITTLNDLIQIIEEILEDAFDIEYSGLYIFDSVENRLKLVYSKGLSEAEIIDSEQTAWEKDPGQVFHSQQMIYVPDIQLNQQKINNSNKRYTAFRSQLCLPVICKNQAVGAFEIGELKPNAFTEDDIAILSFICNFAGALYNNILNQNLLKSNNEQILLLSELPDENPNPVLRISYNSILLYANSASKPIMNYYGLKEGEIVSQDFMAPLRKLFTSGKSFEYEISINKSIYSFFFTLVEGKKYVNLFGRDITTSKRIENEQVINEAKHTKMVANISDVIVIINEKSIITYISPNIEKLFGWKSAEIIDNMVFENIHPNDLGRINNIFGSLLSESANTMVEEFLYHCKDGSYKYVEFTAINLLNDPDINGILGNYHDITTQKYAEGERMRQSTLTNALLDSIPDVIYFKDTEGVYLGCNPSFTNFIGKPKNEIIGKTDFELFDKEIAENLRTNDLQIIEQKKSFIFEEWVPLNQGIKVLFETRKEPYWANDGSLIGLLGISRNITARKLAELKLRGSEERFHQLAEHSRVITWEVDANGLYTYISNVCTNVLGYLPEDIIGKKYFNDLHSTDEGDALRTSASAIFTLKEPFRNLEIFLKSKNGQFVWFSSNGIPIIDDNGLLMGYRGTDTDISERKEAEEKLNKLHRAVEQSPVMTYITDLKGTIEYANPKVVEITGYKKEELLGQNPRIFNSGENSKEMYVNLWQTLNSGKEWKGEFRNRKKNGDLFWVMATLSPIFDKIGKISHFIAIEEDITQRKNNLEDLQIANLRFRLLISSLQAGVMLEDEKRKVVLVNQHLCDFFSISVPPEQLGGMNCEESAHVVKDLFIDPDTFISDIEHTLELNKVVINHEIKMKNGVSLDRDFIPIVDSDNKSHGILWIYRNITQRKNNERDLLRQSQILNGTANAMNYLLTLHDFDQAIQKALETIGSATGVDRVYIFENNESSGESFFSQRFEWTAEGIIPQIDNKELQNMPYSTGFPRWYNLFSAGITVSGLSKDFPENERKILESEDILSIIAEPIFVNDHLWGMVGFDDCSIGIEWSPNEISILKALAGSIGGSISKRLIENELINSRNIAENATKSKSEFLATMSHEIRTPMNGVIGMTSLLLQTQLTPDQRDYTETIKISGELLLSVINDILDFSKIESGKMILEEHRFELRLAIEDVLDLMATEVSQKKLGLHFQIDPAIPPQITGDLTRLRQILVNLVGNAIKFTSAGEVVISVKQIEKQGNEAIIEFSVKDTGIGIPENKIERLFKPFSQVDASTTRKHGGTGLGLAICSKLVKLMNGNFRVKSEINRGSEFIFTIKTYYSDSEEQSKYPLSDQQIMKGKKILIVDVNPTSNAILCDLSNNAGMHYSSANSAKMTLDIINEKRDFDMIVIDNDLSDMDTNLLAFEIKKTKEYAEIPLILISNPTSTDSNPNTVNNFHVRINKPLKHSQLISYIVNLLTDIKSLQIKSINQPIQLQKINEIYPLKILVAEDNAINQKLILKLFEMLGYNIQIAANGFEVIDALNRMEIDIVFMDIQMPEMDGFEATQQIIAKWADQRPLIVAMTANALKSDREKYLAAGMDDYISKPLTINQVKIGIEKWTSLCNTKNTMN